MPRANELPPLKPLFQRGAHGSTKADARGQVVVKLILQDPKKIAGQPVVGNRREDIVIENTSVGEVAEAINRALFGEQAAGQ